MASLESVRQKLYRARHHFLELEEEMRAYYSDQGTVELCLVDGGINIGALRPVPARFGLIAGDVLQCLRSSLDYLVWELVLANNQIPDSRTAFPISLTRLDYTNQVRNRKRLSGVSDEACALIDTLQPLHLFDTERESCTLAALERLTNINKHRRVLLTSLKRVVIENEPLTFRHILSDLKVISPDGKRHPFVTFAFFLAFDEGVTGGEEICTTLNYCGDHILCNVLPLFERFF